MRCTALGCHSAPAKNGLFCRRCWDKIPTDLRSPDSLKKAVVHLGKLDGYLVDMPTKHAANITDHAGGEYV